LPADRRSAVAAPPKPRNMAATTVWTLERLVLGSAARFLPRTGPYRRDPIRLFEHDRQTGGFMPVVLTAPVRSVLTQRITITPAQTLPAPFRCAFAVTIFVVSGPRAGEADAGTSRPPT
jgi:hypothetical protein